MLSQVILATLTDPYFILLAALGAFIGICFGAIPGLNTPVAIALVLPITYSLNLNHTLALIMGIFMGGISGGLISAILLKLPGTAAAIATCLDGYPMTAKGQAAEAMAIGTFASFFGGIFSAIILIVATPALSRFALSFGPWEYFGAIFLACTLVCTLCDGSFLKGMIATCIGILLATVGLSPIDGQSHRMTFGWSELNSGFSLIIVVIGVFAFTELIRSTNRLKEEKTINSYEKKLFYFPNWKRMWRQKWNLVRSSILGTFIGVLPGIGATVAGMFSYAQAKRFSKHPELFGTGIDDGVVASEAANNAVTGGALVPTLSLSVPGDPSTAVILSALTIQGLQCGPMLVIQHQDIFYTVIIAVLLANIFMYVIQACSIRFVVKIIEVPLYYLVPAVVLFCAVGAYTINNRSFDLLSLLLFIVIGWILADNQYPTMPLIIGFTLGSMLEVYYRRTLSYYGDLPHALISPSFGTVLVAIGILFPIINMLLDRRLARKKAQEQENAD